MNRIIIIGNGFDLAHDLKTSYTDFFNYLKDSVAKYEKTGTNTFRPSVKGIRNFKDSRFIHRKIDGSTKCKWIGVREKNEEVDYKLASNPNTTSLYFKSLFNDFDGKGYWSDIEHHYFKVLNQFKQTERYVSIINEEFEYLKNLLEDYLKVEVEDKITNQISTHNSIYKMLRKNNRLSNEFDNNYLITFNYTSKYLDEYLYYLRTYHEDKIKNKFNTPLIHIHGSLKSKDNPIILGYGDENSNDYKELELSDNNELLKNFKTFQYLRTSKYAEVLGLLETTSEMYVQIVGHSCGICDKALLRTIFQHENIKYIEATYYQDESKYFENLYNISRIFDDNTLMRERIVSLEETFMIK